MDASFIHKIDRTLDSFVGGGYDPFPCAQDVPTRLDFSDPEISGDSARVVMREVWNPGTQYEMARQVTTLLWQADGQWKVVDILCPLTSTTPTWQLYRNDEYGFQINYPIDWTLQEAQIDAAGTDMPRTRARPCSL